MIELFIELLTRDLGASLAILPLAGLASSIGGSLLGGVLGKRGTQETTKTSLDPRLQNIIFPGLESLNQTAQGLAPLGQQAQQIAQNSVQFNPSSQLDAFSQNLLSQGQQSQLAQGAAQQRNIARQFRSQPGVSNVLQQQAALQNNLQQNPLLFQVAQAQRDRQVQDFNAQAQAQQLALSSLGQAQNLTLNPQQQALQSAMQAGQFANSRTTSTPGSGLLGGNMSAGNILGGVAGLGFGGLGGLIQSQAADKLLSKGSGGAGGGGFAGALGSIFGGGK